jgi:hypothetical protein
MGYEGVVYLAQDWDQCHALVPTAMNRRVPKGAQNFLIS